MKKIWSVCFIVFLISITSACNMAVKREESQEPRRETTTFGAIADVTLATPTPTKPTLFPMFSETQAQEEEFYTNEVDEINYVSNNASLVYLSHFACKDYDGLNSAIYVLCEFTNLKRDTTVSAFDLYLAYGMQNDELLESVFLESSERPSEAGDWDKEIAYGETIRVAFPVLLEDETSPVTIVLCENYFALREEASGETQKMTIYP